MNNTYSLVTYISCTCSLRSRQETFLLFYLLFPPLTSIFPIVTTFIHHFLALLTAFRNFYLFWPVNSFHQFSPFWPLSQLCSTCRQLLAGYIASLFLPSVHHYWPSTTILHQFWPPFAKFRLFLPRLGMFTIFNHLSLHITLLAHTSLLFYTSGHLISSIFLQLLTTSWNLSPVLEFFSSFNSILSNFGRCGQFLHDLDMCWQMWRTVGILWQICGSDK